MDFGALGKVALRRPAVGDDRGEGEVTRGPQDRGEGGEQRVRGGAEGHQERSPVEEAEAKEAGAQGIVQEMG